MKTVLKYREQAALTLILLLAAFLSVYNIWNLGYSNEFYAASVKSMLTGWKNFFFASLDPGGWITVDKPPVSLWVQAAFAKVFGFYGWSIILPQCLAAVATVAIIYRTVRRRFGAAAGLISALVLALSPIFIVVSKTNNTDSVLIFFMALSAWAMMEASDRGQLRYLILSMVFLGVAYNAKTLEAYLILPALYAVYFFATKIRWRTRVWHLAVATLVLLVVSLSWSVIVDLTPASERPYVDNSSNNSELELALGYNGIQRIFGESHGNSGGNPDGEKTDSSTVNAGRPMQNGQPTEVKGTESNASDVSQSEDGGLKKANSNGSAGGPGGNGSDGNMFNGGGNAGILRMFNTTLGGQDSWLLPLGLFSILAMLLGMRKAEEERRRKLLRGILLWGGSAVTMVAYFSVAQFFHPYYVSVMAPCLAALIGIGVVELWRLYRAGGFWGYLLPAAFAVTLAVQIGMLQSYLSFSRVLIPLIGVATGIPVLLLIFFRFFGKNTGGRLAISCVVVGLAGLLIVPAVWTGYSVLGNNFNSALPSAGPSAGASGFGMTSTSQEGQTPHQSDEKESDGGENGAGLPGGGGNQDDSASDTALIDFLEGNNTGEKFLIAVPSAREAEPIILATGKPVMAVGGFSGNSRSLTVEKLKQLVTSGELKYYLVGGRGGDSDEVTQWVKEHGVEVDSSVWNSSSGLGAQGGGSQTLYDLSACQNES